MNSSSKGRNILAIWAVVLFVFTVSAIAAAGNKPSAPQSHGSAPAAHAPAAHAPAAHAPAQHAGAPAGNRGPGGTSGMNRGPGGNANSKSGTGANGMNRGPGGNANASRGGATGNNANRGATGNANRGGTQTGNRAGTQGGNRAGATGANRAGSTQGGNRGGAQAGKSGNAAGNRGGNAGGNRGNQSAGNRQPKGAQSHVTKTGNHVTTRANGSVRSISGHGVTVNRGVHGQRRVAADHNGRHVVAYGRHGGYSQRAYYRHGGHEYYQRTYYRGGRAYAYGYRGYAYGGYNYYGYAPSYYWGPAYYGWAYNPWPAPVTYGWGWGGAPWYGYYGAYWNPYPVYPSAAFWLTDFFVAAALQAAYTEQAEAAAENGELVPPQFNRESSDVIASLSTSDPLVAANLSSIYGSRTFLLAGAAPAGSSGPAMTKEIKDAIAEEIKNQIAAEKTAAANKDKAGNDSGPPAALDPNIRYFVVANEEDLTTSDGTECTLTGGDVVFRTGDTPDDDHMVDATVKASRKDECAVGATVGVSTDDLMDMYNNLRQNMADGMKEMAAKNGKNGLPKAPDTSTTAGEIPAPTPDSNVQDDLSQAQKDADSAESDAKQPN